MLWPCGVLLVVDAFVWFEGLLVFPLVFNFLGLLLSSPPFHFLPFLHFFLSFSTFGVSLFLSLNF